MKEETTKPSKISEFAALIGVSISGLVCLQVIGTLFFVTTLGALGCALGSKIAAEQCTPLYKAILWGFGVAIGGLSYSLIAIPGFVLSAVFLYFRRPGASALIATIAMLIVFLPFALKLLSV